MTFNYHSPGGQGVAGQGAGRDRKRLQMRMARGSVSGGTLEECRLNFNVSLLKSKSRDPTVDSGIFGA